MPTNSLPVLNLVTPIVNGDTLSIDSTVLPCVVDADPRVTSINVALGSQSLTFTNYLVNNGLNRFTFSLNVDNVLVQLVGWDAGKSNFTPLLKFQLLEVVSQNAAVIGPPTGAQVFRQPNNCILRWVTPTYNGFIGVRVVASSDSSGVTNPYLQIGDLVSVPSSSANVPLVFDTTVSVDGDTTTSTTVTQTQLTNYSSISIPQSSFAGIDTFYAKLTTVIQDPNTGIVYESQPNGPLTMGFVDLTKVAPLDFLALQRKEDIARRLIERITLVYPDLDLTPRSELRDTLIDPVSIELANLSVREWFARVSTSISSLNQLDDTNGDGFSDSFAESTVKQQLAAAFGLSSTDMQTYIDKQFDVLGERVGLQRGVATPSSVQVTFYTYQKPQSVASFPVGTVVATVPTTNNLNVVEFATTASVALSPEGADSYYDDVAGWWAVTVPAICQTPGTVGNVGAGSIRTLISGGSAGWSVQNLNAAGFGTDQQSNQSYAYAIQNRQIAGIDTGTSPGFANIALTTPGVSSAKVVGAGDIEMLRDWEPTLSRHLYGCVDVYVGGNITSEEDTRLPFTYRNTSDGGVNVSLKLIEASSQAIRFQVVNFSQLPYPLEAIVEIRVSQGAFDFFLGTKQAVVDNSTGTIILSLNELAYHVVDGNVIYDIGTNSAALGSVSSSALACNFSLFGRYRSPLVCVSEQQPILAVNSVTGGAATGVVTPAAYSLLRTTDFLLSGMSNKSGDTVQVSNVYTVPIVKNITFSSTTMPVDSAMQLAINPNTGQVGDVLSVRSLDSTTLYTYGTDYILTPNGRYNSFSIQLVSGSSIAANQTVQVAYNRYVLSENVSFHNAEQVTFTSTSVSLAVPGFIQNTWLPLSYGLTQLVQDSLLSSVYPTSRYIKVTMNNGVSDVLLTEGLDYVISVDTSGTTTLTRLLTGKIASNSTVSVSYFTAETYSIKTQYPAYVTQLANTLATTKHASADVLVKAMIANAIDIAVTINLESSVDVATVDNQIRTAIDMVLNNSGSTLRQSVLVRQIQAVPGVAGVNLPLTKCVKSDGSYVVGEIISTGTTWTSLANNPAFAGNSVNGAYITANPVLRNPTIPSGGTTNSYVGLLYEGESYRRALSVSDFLNNLSTPSFYIVGKNDTLPVDYMGRVLLTPPTTLVNPDPSLRAYRVTYQCWNAEGAADITLSSTEYLTAGTITISYNTLAN